MASAALLEQHPKRDIFQLARTCESLFLQYTSLQFEPTENRARADLQLQRFYVWASYLGVFASYDASLDKRLEYSDQIQDLVLQLLSLVRLNLEFLNSEDLNDKPMQIAVETESDILKTESKSKLQGTPTEALDAVEATINRLNSLGITIRRYSASSLDDRVKAFANKHGDESYRYTEFAKQIVYYKYRAASPSLQWQLALSMSARRQRLEYIRRHQEKLAIATQQKVGNEPANWLQTKRPDLRSNNAPTTRSEEDQRKLTFGPSNNKPLVGALASPSAHTKASTFNQTPSLVPKLQVPDRASVVSSSSQSTTLMAEDLKEYPKPPKKEAGMPNPACPYCYQPLQDSDLRIRKWRKHVDQDLRPFVCISEKCNQQPSLAFPDWMIWANHMRESHSNRWTQLIHKPLIWSCDLDHLSEEFTGKESFEKHLDNQHRDCSEATRRAISQSCQFYRRRGPHICPLCGYDVCQPRSSGASPDQPKPNDAEGLTKLTKHIAGHLRGLAFYSVNNLGAEVDGDSFQGSIEISNRKKLDGSKTRPPSGVKDLSHVSLNFTDPAPLNFGTEAAEFDADWSHAELTLLGAIPEELSLADAVDWDAVKANLKRHIKPEFLAELEHDQEPESSDPIFQHLLQQKLLREPFDDDIGPLEFQDDCGGPASGFDLVFVHGLRGSRLKTWSRDGIFWPHDLLKDDLKNTRVITWGYDANIASAFQYASEESLFGHATTLLGDLARLRPGVTRPIIFICHSLGGLVVKQALITADSYNTHGRPPATFGNIYKSTVGVIFMGTPHRGSSKESYGEIAVNIAKLSLHQPNSQLLRTLKPDSHILEKQRDDFTTISKDMAIVCIREELPTGAGLIVPEASATYDEFNVVRGAIHANHMDMVKFATRVEGYERTLGHIRDIINAKMSEVQKDQMKVEAWNKKILNALRFPGIFEREEMVEQAYAETCSWVWGRIPTSGRTIAEPCEFIPWLRSTEPLLWISGKAGCGKSTLMKHIYRDPRTKFELENSSWAAGKDLIFIGHFFHDRGTNDQKSREGMLRSLLFQVLDMQPHLIPIAFSESRFVHSDHSGNPEYKLEMTTELLTWEILSKAFLSMLQHLGNFKICLFLDGLDEYRMAGREDQYTEQELDLIYDGTNEDEAWGRRWIPEGHKEVARFLFEFSTHKNVKVCISGRELVVFEEEFQGLPRIMVHTHTAGAIAQYCTGRLTKETPDLVNMQKFIAEITNKSLGVFLWVQLVVDMLVDRHTKGDHEKELWATLDKVPARLGGRDGMYMHMIRNIERQYLPESKRLFQLAMRPRGTDHTDIITLFLAEEGHLQDGTTEDLRAISDDYELKTWDEWAIRRDRLQKRLKSRCGGLLEGTRPVQFMHYTAKQFFSMKYLWDEIFLNVDGFTSEVNATLAMASGLIRRLKYCAEAVVIDDHDSSRDSDPSHSTYNPPDLICTVTETLNSVELPHQMDDSPDGTENHAQRLLEELDHVGQRLTRAFRYSYKHFESCWPAAYYDIDHPTSKKLMSFLDLMVVLRSEHYVEMKLRAQVSSGDELAHLLSIAALTREVRFKSSRQKRVIVERSARIIESLLKRGANPNAQDDSQDGFLRSNRTVWICFLQNMSWQVPMSVLKAEIAGAKAFIKYGADPVARWDTGTLESVLVQGLNRQPAAKKDIDELLELLRQAREKSVGQEIK